MAKAKPFSNETLLRIRKRQQDLKALDLAVAQREVREAEQKRGQLAAEQRQAMTRMDETAKAHFDVSELRRCHQYERHLAHLIDDTDAAIQQLEGVVEEKRSALGQALQDKRIVEKLKERQNAAHAKELAREAQHAADEVASNYAARLAPGPKEVAE